jgi:hypothetical protein
MIEHTSIGQGHAYRLYQAYVDTIQKSMRHIHLAKIVPHCLSIHSIRLSEKMDFVRQASLPNKIRYMDGTFGNEIVLKWTNPNFCELSLLQYDEYLRSLIDKTPSSTLNS